MKIAIVGSGISGLTCAYLLNREHDITVFEKNDYVGGHTHTHEIEYDGEEFSVDSGFIVYNEWTYPNFIKLLDQLGVERQLTRMGFSVKSISKDYEYVGGHSITTWTRIGGYVFLQNFLFFCQQTLHYFLKNVLYFF